MKNTRGKSKKNPGRTVDVLAQLRNLHWSYWLLILVIVFFAALRFRLREIPLERDEGEYAYSGQLMLQGIPPYRLAYNMKLPGTYAAYAGFMAIFGQTNAGIHSGLLLMNAFTALLIFALTRKLFGGFAGSFAAMIYAATSADPHLLGLAAHAEHFVVFAAVAGLVGLLYAIERDRLALFFLSGTCFGIAFLMKQSGIVFGLFALLYLLCAKWKAAQRTYFVSRIGALLAGMVWPFAVTCLVAYEAGVFSRFWFWTFSYARTYEARVPLANGLRQLTAIAPEILRFGWAIWVLCLIGLVSLFWSGRHRSHWFLVTGLLMFSFLGISAGLYFRSHYFLLLLPAVAMLGGIAVDCSTRALRDRRFRSIVVFIPTVAFASAVIAFLVQERQFLFPPDAIEACRRLYPNNPFVEAQQIGEYLKSTAPPNARIAVLGSEPEIYFSSQLHSVTGYIYTYSLMEDQKYAARMREEMIHEVSNGRPEYIVFVDDALSWLWQPGENRERFFAWMQIYINSQYIKAAQVDIAGSPQHLLENVPRIYVFRRKA